jgi:DNA-binding LacI/PurR family transcriptional regulator
MEESKPVHPPVTIVDVAREAKVSAATVSNYLNGRSHKLSAATSTRIRAVIERLGYTPSLGAQRMSALGRSGSVGVLMRRSLAESFAEPFFAQVFGGIGRAFDASATRGLVMTRPATAEGASETAYPLSLSRGIVDGFLVFDIEAHDATLKLFAQRHVPFVAFGQLDDSIGPCIGTDHAAGVREATAWLIRQGHRRFAFAKGSSRLLLNQHRQRGMRQAQVAAGLAAEPTWIYDQAEHASPEAWLGALLGEEHGPTAFLIPPSWYAIWLNLVSKRPPTWPAVEPVLMDYLDQAPPNARMPARLEPPTAEIGRRGAEMLDDYIVSGDRPDSVLLPAKFIPPDRP